MNRNLVKWLGYGVPLVLFAFFPIYSFAQQPLIPCGRSGAPECTFSHLFVFVKTVINFLIVYIAVPGSALLFAYAGFLFLTARGSSGQVEKAKGIFLDVFVGLVIALAGWLVVNFILIILTGDGIGKFVP